MTSGGRDARGSAAEGKVRILEPVERLKVGGRG
jgi:hypothetical protein